MPSDTSPPSKGEPGYKGAFFSLRHTRTEKAAHTILGLVLHALPPVRSAVDMGCGVGTWLKVAKELGTETINGFDGDYVDLNELVIARGEFTPVDFTAGSMPGVRADLAISLEVAEHLPESRAAGFVRLLCDSAPAVLFSAAVKGQGGMHHVNEQPQSYWIQRFHECGYEGYDFIRPRIWDDPEIDTWYRQNTLFFCSPEFSKSLPEWVRQHDVSLPHRINDMVHPDTLTHKVFAKESIKGLLRRMARILRNRLRGRA